MTPIIKVHTTPECNGMFHANHLPYRVEINGRAIGPILTEKESHAIARWLDQAWPEIQEAL